MKQTSTILFIYFISTNMIIALFYIYKVETTQAPPEFKSLIIAHRGNQNLAPENSIQAIEYTKGTIANAIEIDVQQSKDLKLVVIHDSSIDRTTKKKGLVKNKTQNELKNLGIPSLEEAAKSALENNLILEIELKHEITNRLEMTKEIDLLFEKYNLYNKAFVSSFDPRLIYYVKKKNSKIITSLSYIPNPPYNRITNYILRLPIFREFIGVNIIGPKIDMLTKRLINKWKNENLEINAWGVKTAKELKVFQNEGISITTSCLYITGC